MKSNGTIASVLGIDMTNAITVMPSPGWVNPWGAVFGGYVAGVLLHALESAAPPTQELSVASISFVERLLPQPATIEVQLTRRGREASHFIARLEQDGSTIAVASAWASVEADFPAVIHDKPPSHEAPEQYPPRAMVGDGSPFDLDLDVRLIERDAPSKSGRTELSWMTMPRVDVPEASPLPLGVLGVLGDLIGSVEYRTAKELGDYGVDPALLSLDLTFHLLARPQGPWVLGVSECEGVAAGRAVATGKLSTDPEGYVAASVSSRSCGRWFL